MIALRGNENGELVNLSLTELAVTTAKQPYRVGPSNAISTPLEEKAEKSGAKRSCILYSRPRNCSIVCWLR